MSAPALLKACAEGHCCFVLSPLRCNSPFLSVGDLRLDVFRCVPSMKPFPCFSNSVKILFLLLTRCVVCQFCVFRASEDVRELQQEVSRMRKWAEQQLQMTTQAHTQGSEHLRSIITDKLVKPKK